jgi:DNA polymerase
MTASDERATALRRMRDSLQELVADGVDFLPRPARVAATPAAKGFRPRVAPLAAPTQISDAANANATQLAGIRADLGDCRRCGLCEKRKQIVFGEGAANARVVFVGEGPGEEEDKSGRPFVGRAGELLTKMIEAVGWRREDVYICNIVKCRPPGNRDPLPEEVAACRPFLERQIHAIAPRAIVTLGKPAISTLLGRSVAITKLRGQWQEFAGIPVLPTYHPAYLLRNYTRETRQAVWDDLRAVRERVDGTRAP